MFEVRRKIILPISDIVDHQININQLVEMVQIVFV